MFGVKLYYLVMEQKIREILAYNLKVERAKKGFTQDKLAELADIAAKHLTKIENKKVTPSLFIVMKLANALDVKIDKLVYMEI